MEESKDMPSVKEIMNAVDELKEESIKMLQQLVEIESKVSFFKKKRKKERIVSDLLKFASNFSWEMKRECKITWKIYL